MREPCCLEMVSIGKAGISGCCGKGGKMSERGGFYNILKLGTIYSLMQKSMGWPSLFRFFIEEWIKPQRQDILLDLGCGPADLCDYLSREVCYCGLDPNPEYIRQARARYRDGSKRRFWCVGVSKDAGLILPDDLPCCNIAVSIGVLHHLDEREAELLLQTVRKVMESAPSAVKPRFMLLDNCLIDKQNPIANWLIRHDRGRYARHYTWYEETLRRFFPEVKIEILHNMLRLPYTQVFADCRIS